MFLKLVPRFHHNYTWREWIAALNVWRKFPVSKLEQAFSSTFSCQYGVMFAHGRTALFALFKTWGIENREVICPAYTCSVVADAIVLSGNEPRFVDCADNSPNMSLDLLEKSITEHTRAIVVTHLFGYPMNVRCVQKIATKASQMFGHKIYVVQDCAHSFGAKWDGELVTMYGDAAIFGMNISKLVNSVFGGMAITNDRQIEQKLRSWRAENCLSVGWKKSFFRFCYFTGVYCGFNSLVYGLTNWLERKGTLDRFTRYIEEGRVSFPDGWDSYPSDLEARVGMAQIKRYNSIVKRHQTYARKLIQQLSHKDIKFFPHIEGATYSHLVALVDDRDAWVETYRNKNVQLGIIIEYSLPLMTSFARYRTGPTPLADYYSKHMINFPLQNSGYL